MKAIRLYFPILLAAALLLGGCSTDPVEKEARVTAPEGDGVELTLKINVPGLSAMSSRAMSATNEKSIRELDVLVFAEDSGEEYFLYRTHATDIKGDGSEKTFKVYLKESEPGVEHRLVLLANVRKDIDAMQPFLTTMTKAEVLSGVSFSAAEEWVTDGNGFMPVPMWGQAINLAEVNSSATAASFGTIKMIRALARIDVGVNMQKDNGEYVAQGNGDMFKISKVSVYNTVHAGLAAPGEDALDATAYTKVTKATPSTTLNPDAMEYALSPAGYGLIREIYVAEAAAPVLPTDKPLFLVIGGYYDGSSTETFYRVDLFDATQNGYVHYDVMRNYRYGVNITNVSAAGYSSEADAAASLPSNMIVEVTYEPEDVGDILYNGQYMLGVSTRKFELGKFATDVELFVTADHPDGWEYAVSTSATEVTGSVYWIKNYSKTDGKLMFDLFDDVDNSDAGRTAYIHISSGALSLVVEVTQTNFEELRLSVNPVSEIVFESGKAARPVQAQTIALDWSPTVSDITVTVTRMVNNMTFVTSPSPSYAGGTATVTILPSDMDDRDLDDITFQHVSRVDFTLTHRGRTLTKSVILRQIHPAVETEWPNPAGYPLLGGLEYLTVAATVPWHAELIGGGEAIDTFVSSDSSIGTPGGEEFQFKMQAGWENATPDEKHYGESVIRFTSPDGAFHPVDVPIKAYWGYPFCYWKDDHYEYRVAHFMEFNTRFNRAGGRSHCSERGGNGRWRLGGGQDHHGFYKSFTNSYLNRQKIGIKENEYYMTDDGVEGAGKRYYVNLSNGHEYSDLSGDKFFVRCMRTM